MPPSPKVLEGQGILPDMAKGNAMSEWNAFRLAPEAAVTPEQEQRLQLISRQMEADGMIRRLPGAEQVGQILVSRAPEREAQYRWVMRTAGMVKASWEDAFCVPWQAWVAADGEIVRVFCFTEDQLEDGIDGDWIEQDGRCAAMNALKVGA